MAKQEGVILLNGNIGELSFYKTRHGYFVRKKTCISGARVKSDRAFARTRQNATEFGKAARAGKLLRTAFEPLMEYASDSRVTSRLAGALVKVIRGDTIHSPGHRTIMARNTALLEDFNFNRHGALHKTLHVEYSASIDRTSGSFSVHVPAFDPSKSVWMPTGATHLRITACGASVDFGSGAYERAVVQSSDIALDKPTCGPITLSAKIAGTRSRPIFVALSVEFLQATNGKRSVLQDQTHNAMAIVKVDGATDESSDYLPQADRKPNPEREGRPSRRPQTHRIPVPRPPAPLPDHLPAPFRSIVAEALKSRDMLDRLLSTDNTFGGLTPEARAALGLFKIAPAGGLLCAPSDQGKGDKVRDGP